MVVSNTSPITNLAAIDQFGLLGNLFGEVYIAEGVWEELNVGGRHPGSREVEASGSVHRQAVTSQSLVNALSRDLDRGESETLALALELEASVVLVDEKEGRHAAERLGLRPLGVLGILLLAKKKGLLSEVRSSLDALRQRAGFYISDELYDRVIVIAGE